MRKPNMTLADVLRETHVAPEMRDRLARRMFNMGSGRYQSQFSTGGVQLPSSAAETVLLTTPIIMLPYDQCSVLILGHYTAAVNASATNWFWRVRRDGLTGVIVGGSNSTGTSVTPAAFAMQPFFAVDTAPGSGGQAYVFTIAAAGATGPSFTPSGVIAALIL
jgi:hypothetical protein